MIPKWPNHCNHPDHTFMGWVRSGTDLYDVYVFPSSLGTEVCARFGKERPDYASIGTVTNLFQASYVAEHYRDICQFLLSRGKLTYHPDNLPSL